MKKSLIRTFLLILLWVGLQNSSYSQDSEQQFHWPDGNQIALSLSFDDARPSQVLGGTELLNRYDAKATFYVNPGSVRQHLGEWKEAVASGHEIGNHSLNHPCTGNFEWSRDHALEEYTMREMKSELIEANKQIHSLLGVTPISFAYPCGETFVGRGKQVKSYIPLVADLFSSGRTWLDETGNAPEFCDLAHLRALEMDGKDFNDILPILQNAKENGLWIILAGHEMTNEGEQTTRLSMLEELLKYAQNPDNGIWLAPVKDVQRYLSNNR
ncbi:MAG: polysaccharide deacetylase family protein [Bacteroidetes bacterium]|jgi:peptidoglycan/xylan/chitin deacetylase (PgdA/CDA1 family)|nr:polysaccharide deacetylase family protein [Bacteroidota bacterium]